MKKEDHLHQALTIELHRKWTLVEMKRRIICMAYHLLDDDMYTKEEAVWEMFEIVKMIEDEERGMKEQHFKGRRA